MRNQVFKKLFSVLLALIMVAGLLPASAMAGGWEAMDVETTPVPTETVQPTESAEPTAPTETETPEVTEVPEPTPENPATTVEPTQGEPTAEPTDEGIMPANVMPVQAATEISYVTKTKNVPLPDGTFYRIVHLDCGRKYFPVEGDTNTLGIKDIIDYAAENNYTHVELAFGNDGLRFLLGDMKVIANGTTYASEAVTSAIKAGNDAFDNAAGNGNAANTTEELTEQEMNDIIAYAKEKGVGIIPMFDAPGHLYAVITAMGKLGINVTYSNPSNSGSSPNWAINPTDVASISFVQALIQKYISYFAGKGCTMFNIAADECGFAEMDGATYTAYVKLVNSMAAMVQNAGMTALAFNDGINYVGRKSSEAIDTDIAVCYWTAGNNYATAANLANSFKIINTNTHWYYVIGKENGNLNGDWGSYAYYYNYAVKNMSTEGSCLKVDGDSKNEVTPAGCMAAIWCDNPSASATKSNVKSYVAALKTGNHTYFNAEEVKVPAVEISENQTNVKTTKETVDGKTVYKAAVKADGTSKIQLKVVNIDNTVNWASDNKDIATVDENGIVTFTGVAGTVTITATPVAATRSINETAAYSITLNVEVEGDVKLEERPITVTVGGTATDVIEGYDYSGNSYTTENTNVATVVSVEKEDVAGTTNRVVDTSFTSLQSNGKYEGLIADAHGNYLLISNGKIAATQNANEATIFTVTKSNNGATIKEKNGSNYLCVSYNSLTPGTNSYSWSVGTGSDFYNNNRYLVYNSGWSFADASSNWNACGKLYGFREKTTEAVSGTKVTFSGVAEGTTSATIGHVKYTIEVAKEDVTNVAALPVQLWITNNPIEVDTKTYSGGSTSGSFRNNNTWSEEKAWYVNVSAVDAYGVNGVALSKVLPASMQRYENNITYWIAEQTDKTKVELALWSGKVHTKANSNIQMVWGADYSNDGDEFNYIRYYSGKWEVSATGNVNDWKEVKGTGSTENYSVCTEQLAVYYMIRSKITEEITTDVADWGYMSSDKDYAKQINNGYYVMLDFAVKIDGAERKPSSFPQANKTFVFHCNSDDTFGAVQRDSSSNLYRRLNNFRAVDNLGENYEVYKVTVTMTNDGSSNSIQNTNSYAYEGKEQIIWAIDEDVRNASGLNNYVSISGANSVYSGCKIGGDPYIRGVEVYNQHGALITYYIRAKAVLSNLRVHYRIEGSDKDFYSYGIIAGENVVFGKDFGKDENSATLLKDNVITDSDGHTITVTAKLEKVDGMGAQYKYGNYTFKGTAREDKDVYLYYTFNANVTFVVDFGLPLKIMPTDVAPNLAIANIESVTASSQMSRYADVTIGDNYSIIYTLKSMISDADLVSVTYEGTNLTTSVHDSAAFNIHIIPATNVYYEDSFAKFTNGSGTAAGATWTIFNNNGGTLDEQQQKNSYTTQALEALGEKTNHNVYGYDPAYDSCTMFSMGSARKVTVTSTMATTGVVWPTAQFTFKGTGFDIISLTNNTSGAIFVDVYKGNSNSGEREKGHVVNNYYGYTYSEENGWEINNNPNAIYQVPVIKVSGLTYGEHTVVIKVCYDKIFDVADGKKYSFWLDAVRVYDPAGNTLDNDYVKDSEVKPIYVEVRKALIGQGGFTADGSSLTNGAVFIDGKSTGASIDDYKNFGPNHEVYLASSQAIAFRIVADKKPATVQIGVKLANGSTGTLKISDASGSTLKFAKYNGSNGEVAENESLTLNTATDMYYALNDITWTAENGSQKSNVIVLTNTGENSIVSITNVKCTYANTEESTTNTVALAISYDDALMAVDMVNNAITPIEPEPEPEPEKTFEPERFEASWSRNVMQGRKATLTVKTSEDVEAITVDGQTIRSYRTRTERVGFGRRAKRITYREFTYSMVAQESADFSVTAINAEGTESEAITARLTVKTRPNSMRDMWDWFKGWF